MARGSTNPEMSLGVRIITWPTLDTLHKKKVACVSN